MLDAAVQATGGDKRHVRMLEDGFSREWGSGPNRAVLPQRDDSADGRRGWSKAGRNEAALVTAARQGSGSGLRASEPRWRQSAGGPRARRGRQGSVGGGRDSSRAAVRAGEQVQSAALRAGKMGDWDEILVQGFPARREK